MADQRPRRRNTSGSENRIPQRVENAARSMSDAVSSGPRRGYIPPDTGRIPPAQGGWQQAGRQMPVQGGYYQGQNPQQPYYPMNGAQRGFIMPSGQMNRQQNPKNKHTFLIVFAILIVVTILGTGGYFAVTDYLRNKTISDKVEPYDNLFCPGVVIDGINLEGMTYEQAVNSIQSQIQQRHDAWKVQLTYNGEQLLEINSDMLGFSVDPSAVIAQAWEQGHTGDQEQRYEAMLKLEQEPYTAYTAQPAGNTQVIDQKLAEIKAMIDQPAKDATMEEPDFTQIYPFRFTDEAYGRVLNIEPIKEQLYRMVSTMQSGAVSLENWVERLEPQVTKAELMKHYTLRSDVYTVIDRHSEENRNNNIRRAFEYINGYKLEPGRTFSFNKVVGERTEARGFYEATEYVSDEHVRGIGGGVCQASTTLYQAAVRAGLQILNREPHSDSVSYAEYGKDATVYWFKGGKKIDFTFKNNTDNDIYILSFVQKDPQNKKRLVARVIIYGEDMGDVWYDIVTEEVETIPCMLSPKYVAEKNEVAKAKDGHVVDSYRVEYTGNQETGRVKLYRDTYTPKPEKIYDPSLAGGN